MTSSSSSPKKRVHGLVEYTSSTNPGVLDDPCAEEGRQSSECLDHVSFNNLHVLNEKDGSNKLAILSREQCYREIDVYKKCYREYYNIFNRGKRLDAERLAEEKAEKEQKEE